MEDIGNARPLCDHLLDIFARDFKRDRGFQSPALFDDLQVFLFQILLEPVAGCFFELLCGNGVFNPAVDHPDPALDIDHLFRDGGGAQFDTRARPRR